MGDITIEIVVSVLTGMVALIGIGTFAFKHLKSWYQRIVEPMRAALSLQLKLDSLNSTVSTVLQELRPNGGATIKDALTRIEQRQVLTDQRYLALISQRRDGVCELNASGDIVWVSPSFCRIFNMIPSELLYQGWVNGVEEVDRDRVLKEWNDAVTYSRGLETYFHTHTQPPVKVLLRTTKMLDLDGSSLGFMGTLTVVDMMNKEG